jgi:hypothetical protein
MTVRGPPGPAGPPGQGWLDYSGNTYSGTELDPETDEWNRYDMKLKILYWLKKM